MRRPDPPGSEPSPGSIGGRRTEEVSFVRLLPALRRHALHCHLAGNRFVRRALVRLDYGRLGKPDKGLVRRYLAKVTGRSRAQPTRLIGQHRETGRIEDRRGGAPAHPFERRYTRADVRRLAVVDAAMGQMSGPATRALMRRQYERFGDGRFERLAGLSNGHLYNPRFRGGRLCAAR